MSDMRAALEKRIALPLPLQDLDFSLSKEGIVCDFQKFGHVVRISQNAVMP